MRDGDVGGHGVDGEGAQVDCETWIELFDAEEARVAVGEGRAGVGEGG